LGEHQQAREQIELALESALRNLGPDHPTVAIRPRTSSAIWASTSKAASRSSWPWSRTCAISAQTIPP
jgi:hypothetical protein